MKQKTNTKRGPRAAASAGRKGKKTTHKPQAVLDYSTHPHIFRSVLTYLPQRDLATVLRTSRQTGQYAINMLYRTVFLDLDGHDDEPSRSSPLRPHNRSESSYESGSGDADSDVDASNSEVKADTPPDERHTRQAAAERASQRQVAPLKPQWSLSSMLKSTRILETGAHARLSCKWSAQVTTPLSGLQIWRFRATHDIDHNYGMPSGSLRRSCGTGRMEMARQCDHPWTCGIGKYISPPHLVFIPFADDSVFHKSDPLSFLALPALQKLPSTATKLTVALPADLDVPDPYYSSRRFGRYAPKPQAKPVHLEHFELILLPNDSGIFHFAESSLQAQSGTLSFAAIYLARLRDTIVERLRDTECRIRLIGSEAIEQSWMNDVDTLAPAVDWTFEVEVRCAIEGIRGIREDGDVDEVAIQRSRQARLSFTTIRGYISSMDGPDSLGDEEVQMLRRVCGLRG